MQLSLDLVEKRVLGSLMEKDITTPEYYPLTLNALQAACNQKSNREPVMEVTEEQLRRALHSLQEKGLAGLARTDGRVPRFEHRMGEALNLGRRESALLCTLLLRGPQTPGELRGRSERMHRLEDLDEVQLVLQKLIEHDPPLAAILPRQPGTKEARVIDLFGGNEPLVPADTETASLGTIRDARPDEEIAALRAEVAELRTELEVLRKEFAEFRRQFDS